MTEARFHLHCARVYLAQARHFRTLPVGRDFYWTLMQWAHNAIEDARASVMQHQLFA